MWLVHHVAKPCQPARGLDGLEEVGGGLFACLFLTDIHHTNDQTSLSHWDWFPSWAAEGVGKLPEELCYRPIRSVHPRLRPLPHGSILPRVKAMVLTMANQAPRDLSPLSVASSPPSVLSLAPVQVPSLSQDPCMGSPCYQESCPRLPTNSLMS